MNIYYINYSLSTHFHFELSREWKSLNVQDKHKSLILIYYLYL